MQNINTSIPSGYHFPAEWAKHTATWLSWPHKEASWPGKIDTIYPIYAQFIKAVAEGEQVCINVNDEQMKSFAITQLEIQGVDLSKVSFFIHPTNDAWCRDHGPAFLINPVEKKKIIVDWGYNAWGEKYPPYDLDDVIPTRIAKHYDIPVFYPGIVMEGGSVDFNGAGTILTTTACLLNQNRNPHLNQGQIEEYLHKYYGAEQILWLGDGIVGDDTDGHIDDITRFVNEDTVVTVVEQNKNDENYQPLKENLDELKKMRLLNGKQLNIVELPMPDAVIYEDTRLPASYANFYISNAAVVVPTYRCKQDQAALDILTQCFPDRKVIGLDSTDIIWGLGSFHCLSQQEPSV
ncbi:agmatine deiminase family protein [Solitalea lacus]|uniref:agmatine deiminase family protein n=1 Tax=Solitalea lacus TaxID=2911172 RepID=UPI001EDC0032|nr:agmatine deiminase family protein [Solitalea lacus]UKJ08907.1 agmatine deiminase family protein [Solitalea lacus]